MSKDNKSESFNDIYKLIAQLFSEEEAVKMYDNFRGLTITFPTKLLASEYVKSYIFKEVCGGIDINGNVVAKWIREFDYSERQIRRFISEIRLEIDQAEK